MLAYASSTLQVYCSERFFVLPRWKVPGLQNSGKRARVYIESVPREKTRPRTRMPSATRRKKGHEIPWKLDSLAHKRCAAEKAESKCKYAAGWLTSARAAQGRVVSCRESVYLTKFPATRQRESIFALSIPARGPAA